MELALGTLAAGTLALIAAMLVTVLVNGWPSFEANGLGWFGNGGDTVLQFRAMQVGTALPGHPLLYFSAWPLIWGTLLSRSARWRSRWLSRCSRRSSSPSSRRCR